LKVLDIYLFPPAFFLQGSQVLIEQAVSKGHEFVVPAIVSRFIAADQQNCRAARVERIKNTQQVLA
jgi:hypothetical protein